LPLVQLPVLFALYLIFVSDFSAGVSAGLYSFIPHQGGLNHTFLGLLDLTQKSIPLAVLAAAAQYIQVRVGYAGSGSSAGSATARLMSLAVPVITLAVLFRFPAALGLYWLTTTIFSIIQQVVVNRTIKIKP
jgi:YidC/Oxa1 family membrane protein insertase